MGTFAESTSYNEWNVENADIIGIFVHPKEQWVVPMRVPINQIPGYDPVMASLSDTSDMVGKVILDRQAIAAAFPGLPILSLSDSSIVRVEPTGLVQIKAADLYG